MAIPINGNMLKAVRGQRLLSQQELADRSKVSIATIKRIEAAVSTSSCRTTSAERLAKALEVEVEDLSENRFPQIIDLGSDIELYLDRIVDVNELRRFHEWVANMADIRNRVLKK